MSASSETWAEMHLVRDRVFRHILECDRCRRHGLMSAEEYLRRFSESAPALPNIPDLCPEGAYMSEEYAAAEAALALARAGDRAAFKERVLNELAEVTAEFSKKFLPGQPKGS